MRRELNEAVGRFRGQAEDRARARRERGEPLTDADLVLTPVVELYRDGRLVAAVVVVLNDRDRVLRTLRAAPALFGADVAVHAGDMVMGRLDELEDGFVDRYELGDLHDRLRVQGTSGAVVQQLLVLAGSSGGLVESRGYPYVLRGGHVHWLGDTGRDGVASGDAVGGDFADAFREGLTDRGARKALVADATGRFGRLGSRALRDAAVDAVATERLRDDLNAVAYVPATTAVGAWFDENVTWGLNDATSERDIPAEAVERGEADPGA